MCLPGAAGALVGGLAQGLGGMMTAQEDQKNAARIAKARNERLQAALKRNDEYAAVARERFDSRADEQDPSRQDADLNKNKVDAGETIASNIATPDYESGGAISGSAPPIVRSALAKSMLDTFQKSTGQAKALGALGGYSDYWFNQGVGNTSAGRDIGIQNDFARGNMSILPYEQDYAEVQANKPRSGIGGLLSGLGGFLG